MGQQCHSSVQQAIQQILQPTSLSGQYPSQVQIQIQLLRTKNYQHLQRCLITSFPLQSSQPVQKFHGYIKNNKKQGYGQLIFDNNKKYYGYFKNNLPHIKGIVLFSNQHYYIGQFQNGQMNGEGKEVNKIYQFQGEYQNGKKKYGMLKTEQFIYQGRFDGGQYEEKDLNLFHGYGQLIYRNGQKYQGNFQNGQFNGQGIYYQNHNKIIYEGTFKHNLYHGYGKYYWQDGSYYQGKYQNGEKHGNGKYVKDDFVVVGKWENGELVQKEKNLDETSISDKKKQITVK